MCFLLYNREPARISEPEIVKMTNIRNDSQIFSNSQNNFFLPVRTLGYPEKLGAIDQIEL